MARNRREVDTRQKRDEIVAAARRLFTESGYESTGMARIAAEAGVAPNTLYWYFKDKDELLIAILDELVGEALNDYVAVMTEPLDAQILWMLSRFDATAGFVTTVHARMAISPVIQEWHDRFHQMLEALIVSQLALRGVPEAERAGAARIAMFVVEGLLSHHAGAEADRAMIASLLVSRLVSEKK